jgi:hypothetical protein
MVTTPATASLVLNTETLLREGIFIAPLVSEDTGRFGTGLRLTSHGQVSMSDAHLASVWSIQNTNAYAVSVTLVAYASDWQQAVEVPPKTQMFIASQAVGLTHALMVEGAQIDVKAARAKQVSMVTPLF